uniref:Integral membrane protein 2 n=1 Tax=Anas zonorhyncha TaxID=75864 RepID=A0A8B9V853_9AVES
MNGRRHQNMFQSPIKSNSGKRKNLGSHLCLLISCWLVLILPPDPAKEQEDVVVPVAQRRAWCWCMCFGLAFMLAGVILGGAYLYKYFAFQQGGVYFCGIKYIEDGLSLPEPGAEAQSARYHTIEQNIQILEEEDVEFISVPVPEFADSDPADIVHDFHRRLTAYLDLSLDKCYVIPLNTSVVMPPKNFLELLINIKAGTYLPQSYLIHEQMIVTDRIENVDQLGFFIYRLCRGKETYKLQRKEAMKGIQKREAVNCRKIRHFENRFAMETLICEQ